MTHVVQEDPAPANTGSALPAPPERPLWQVFWAFLLPLMVGNILQSASGTINNLFVGQMIGVKALAAVSVFFPVMFFFVAIAIGLGAGASMLIGQAWGAGQRDTVREIAGSTLLLGILLSLVVMGCGLPLVDPLLRILETPPDILHDATRVARLLLVSMVGIFVFILSTSMLRGINDTLAPLYTLLLAIVIGLVLTPALIRGWLGLPRMDVTSGTWAMFFSFPLAMLWLAFHLRRKNSPLKPDAEFLRHMHLNPRLLKIVLRVGVPASVQTIVVALAELVLLSMVNRYGSDATAAYGAVNQVVAYVQVPVISIPIATVILGAQAIGAGRVDQLGAILRIAMVFNLLLTGVLVALGYLFSRQLIGFFITSAPVVEMAQVLLRIMLWSLVIFGMGSVLVGIMRASGTVLMPTLFYIGCIALVELPTAWIGSRHIGLNGVWISYPVAFSVMLLLQWAYYQGVWRKRAVERMV